MAVEDEDSDAMTVTSALYRPPGHGQIYAPELDPVQNGHAGFAADVPLETWRRQERAFRLLKKAYAKRAAIRGQASVASSQIVAQFREWPSDNEIDEQYSC